MAILFTAIIQRDRCLCEYGHRVVTSCFACLLYTIKDEVKGKERRLCSALHHLGKSTLNGAPVEKNALGFPGYFSILSGRGCAVLGGAWPRRCVGHAASLSREA